MTDPSQETRTVHLGDLAVEVKQPSEQLAISVRLRVKAAERFGDSESYFEVFESIIIDTLEKLLVDLTDADRIISLIANDYPIEQLLEQLYGVEPNNRDERRAVERKVSSRSGSRRRGSRGRGTRSR